ncbi:MAG: VWA domain-containing protein [Anaerolineae bacterium]|nr:VWA domain-containing protein [Anaerolineae bacterium]
MSGEIEITTSTNRPVYEVMPNPQQAYLLVEVMPTDKAPAATLPVNFALVLDRSGSMAGQKLTNLKTAAKLVIDRLGAQDLISVVIFDETADLVVPSQAVTDPDAIKAAIDRIDERGGTRMSSGMALGVQQLQAGISPERVSRMLLLTDGQTWEDQAECQNLAEQSRQMGVPLSVLGLGVGDEGNWDPRFLEELAERSGGEWYAVDVPEKVTGIFADTLTAMQGTAVTNAHFTLRMAAEVKLRNAWRAVPMISRLGQRTISEWDVQVFLGDIQHKTGQAVLLDVLLPARAEGAYRLFQCEIAYDVPVTNLTDQRAVDDIIIDYTANATAAAQVNQHMMNTIERVVAFKLQTQALDEAMAGQSGAATQRLRASATRLIELGESAMAEQALEQADQLEKSGSMDQAVAQKMRYDTKRLLETLPEEPDQPGA